MNLKTCKDCGVEKRLSEFYGAPRNSDGRMGKCKLCVQASVRENRRNRSEQYARYEKSRANLPYRVEACRKYQEENRKRISEYKTRWAWENSDRVVSSKRDYYRRNREKIISRSKKWTEDNPEKVSVAKAENRRKRRAAKHTTSDNFTAEQFKELCERYGNKCLACGEAAAVLEADHVLPLTKGGSDDISNIQPLCGPCNRRKFVDTVDYRITWDTPSKEAS